jgi:hypothetical protein
MPQAYAGSDPRGCRRSIPEGTAMKPLKALHGNSQSVWLDCVRRALPDNGAGDMDCAETFVKVSATGPGVQLI